MKGKYMTTSLLLAIIASERSAQGINLPETKASTEGHQLLWEKGNSSVNELRARLHGRDELKIA